MNKRIMKKTNKWKEPFCPICHGEIEYKEGNPEVTSACVKCEQVTYGHREEDVLVITVNGKPFIIDDNLSEKEWRVQVSIYEKVLRQLRKFYQRSGGIRRVRS
ncbi:hypothetical protein_gp271 [Bacillus phage vB_BceM_WH1]|nr:hypothetical protein_gp271 [Bacillus phage vB_BceM_WH1]